MMDMPVAYEGKEPYIFISYAHKDSERVLPLIQALQDSGFRVWYDAGIEAGTEWPKTIADHLLCCGCVLAIVSKASLASQNCKREIYYAISKSLPMLVSYLEEVELPSDMEMQLGILQAVFMYRHATVESFVNVLCREDILKPCGNAEVDKNVQEEEDEDDRWILRELTTQEVQQLESQSPESLYEEGKDYLEKFQYKYSLPRLLIAAQKGYAPAQFELGMCYYSGTGASKNDKSGARWLRLAAEQGYAEGQGQLGVCYCEGKGVDRDEVEAVKLFRLAAEQNNAPGMCNLGLCYLRGVGVEADLEMAKMWLTKAAAEGSKKAKTYLLVME